MIHHRVIPFVWCMPTWSKHQDKSKNIYPRLFNKENRFKKLCQLLIVNFYWTAFWLCKNFHERYREIETFIRNKSTRKYCSFIIKRMLYLVVGSLFANYIHYIQFVSIWNIKWWIWHIKLVTIIYCYLIL